MQDVLVTERSWKSFDEWVLGLQANGRALQSEGEGLLPNLKNNMADTLSSLSTNARTAGENALIELGKHVVRTIGVDSNTQGFATPHSQYGKPFFLDLF